MSSVSYDTAACEGVVLLTEQSPGQLAAQLRLEAGQQEVSGWTVQLEFSTAVDWLESAMAEVAGEATKWSLTSRDWDQTIPAGGFLDLKFLVDYSSALPSVLKVTFNEAELCSGGTVCAAPDCSNNYQVEADHGQWQQILLTINPQQVSRGLPYHLIPALCPGGVWLDCTVGFLQLSHGRLLPHGHLCRVRLTLDSDQQGLRRRSASRRGLHPQVCHLLLR